jgi:membrane fusion protein, heavy metal efflux system
MKGAMSEQVQAEFDKSRRAVSALASDLAQHQLQWTNAALSYLKDAYRVRPRAVIAVAAGMVAMLVLIVSLYGRSESGRDETSNHAKTLAGTFAPTPAQWKTFTIVPVAQRVFRAEHVTEGKVSVNEDRSTLIFSPYSGRVTKLLVKPGETVARGQPLFIIEATDGAGAE